MVVRSVWDGRIRAAWPDTVVQDSDDLLALYLAKGTRFKRTDRRMPLGGWSLIDDIWTADVLLLVTPLNAHSVLLFWDPNQILSSWYINLQTPFERTPIGIDFVDHFLDIIVKPDLSSWEWKDEDELFEATRLGLLSQPMADQIRGEGERVIKQVKAGGPPFRDGWENWRPEPGLPIPELLPGWQVV